MTSKTESSLVTSPRRLSQFLAANDAMSLGPSCRPGAGCRASAAVARTQRPKTVWFDEAAQTI